MKITVTFDSLEEFQEHVRTQATAKAVMTAAQTAQDGAKKAAPEKKDAKKAGTATERPQEALRGPATEVGEDFRVEVRRTLAQLNKKVGKNIASELIKGFGVDKLTAVALSDLPALMDRAKEALDAE